MKKHLFIAAAAVLALASCTTSDEFFDPAQETAQQELNDNAIRFGTYLGKQQLTRAGQAGSINTNVLKGLGTDGTGTWSVGESQKYGFGVFAFYTEDKTYGQFQGETYTGETGAAASNSAANFMFNEQIWWSKTNAEASYVTGWTYAPVKYWPNEFANGAVDDADNDQKDNQATGAAAKGNVSFFAYAPYVSLPISATTSGIVAINGKTDASANAVTGDPTVKYIVATSGDNIVDLLWGTYGSTTGSNVLGSGNAGVAFDNSAADKTYKKAILPHQTSSTPPYDGYKLNADLTKQKTNGKVDFAFKHALAKVGGSTIYSKGSITNAGLMVVADIDDEKGGEFGGTKQDATKITIVSIEVSALTKFDSDNDNEPDKYLKQAAGTLDLATGQWTIETSLDGTANSNVSNDKTGTTPIKHNITSPAGTSVTPSSAELADAIAEKASYTANDWTDIPNGVLTTAQNVYKSEAYPLVFIPRTYPELTITVDYIVRTQDTKLANTAPGVGETGQWTKVRQKITKKVTFKEAVELNKQYSLLIHLGLTGVKFTASVSDWELAGDTNNNGSIDTGENLEVEDVFVPINVGDATVSVTLPASTNSSSSQSSPDKTLAGISADATTVLINLYGVHNGNTLEISAETGGNNDGDPTITPSTVTDSQTAVATVKLLANSAATTKDTVIKITEKNGSTEVSTTYVKLTQVAAAP